MESHRLPAQLTRFFVYGTLKRGQCRQTCWPHSPVSVTGAWTPGHLYDLGDYPALRPAHNSLAVSRVVGEIWEFSAQHVPDVVCALDLIEGTNIPGEPNLYDRAEIRVSLLTPNTGTQQYTAVAYFYANPIPDHLRIQPAPGPNGQLSSQWPLSAA